MTIIRGSRIECINVVGDNIYYMNYRDDAGQFRIRIHGQRYPYDLKNKSSTIFDTGIIHGEFYSLYCDTNKLTMNNICKCKNERFNSFLWFPY